MGKVGVDDDRAEQLMGVFRGPVAVMLFATLGAAQFVGAELARPVQGDQHMSIQVLIAFRQPLVTEGPVQLVEGGVQFDWVDRVADFAQLAVARGLIHAVEGFQVVPDDGLVPVLVEL